MKIVLDSRYMSLDPITVENLASFTLITGVNGSGKSQLFQALQQQHLAKLTFDDGRPATKIVSYTADNFLPKDVYEPQSTDSHFDAEEAARKIGPVTAEYIKQADTWLLSKGQSKGDAVELWRMHASRTRSMSPDSLANEFIAMVEPWNQKVVELLGDENGIYRNASERLSKPISLLTKRDVIASHLTRTPLLSLGFAQAFQLYRDLLFRNDLVAIDYLRGNSDIKELTPEAFVDENGPEPWGLVNETLSQLGIPATISQPTLRRAEAYSPMLRHSNGDEVPFESLSSGEKVILSLAILGYQANASLSNFQVPDVILLDEVDAPLHPSLVKTFLSVCSDILVEKFRCAVFIATHSPSTVALFPKESIYLLTKGPTKFVLTSKQEALNSLTVGVPTLSIDFTGNRQVFCEDESDAEILSHLYRFAKKSIESQRSLVFISSGFQFAEKPVMNSGCEAVKSIVNSLAAGNNKTIFGLIDGDGKATSEGRILVLGSGTRDGLENYVLDPLLVAALVVQSPWFGHDQKQLGLEGVVSRDLLGMTNDQLQSVVNAVQEVVFDGYEWRHPLIEAKYAGGKVVKISSRVREMDDHEYADLVLKAFPNFKKITHQHTGHKAQRDLMRHIAAVVVREFPEFVPQDIVNTFKDLVERET